MTAKVALVATLLMAGCRHTPPARSPSPPSPPATRSWVIETNGRTLDCTYDGCNTCCFDRKSHLGSCTLVYCSDLEAAR